MPLTSSIIYSIICLCILLKMRLLAPHRKGILKYLISIWVFCASQLAFAEPVMDTVLVLIDQKTEQKLGLFPYERDVFAKGIERLAQLGAKEVLLKFFLDAAKNKNKDSQLAHAMTKIPVTLQARIDNSERNPNTLLPQHQLGKEFERIKGKIHGKSGWLPITRFSQNAHAVGFIDSISPALFIERYKNKAVGSLYFHALESIYGMKFHMEGHQLFFDKNKISLNSKGEYQYDWEASKKLGCISYIDLIEGRVDKNKVSGKYVILGYDGAKIHQVPTPAGLMNAHIAFYQSLLSVIASFEKQVVHVIN